MRVSPPTPKKTSLKAVAIGMGIIVIVVIISSILIVYFEQGYPGSKIQSFGDGLWWAAVGISTIGIGTIVPQSPLGKVLNILLMIIGLGIFSVITAIIASFFTEEEVQSDIKQEENQLEQDITTRDKILEKEEFKIESENKVILEELKRIELKLDEINKDNY